MGITVDLGCKVIAVQKYLELKDTPNTYAGQAGKFPKVNDNEDGLEFSEVVSGGVQSVTGDGVGGTPDDVVMSFPDGTEVELVDGGGVSVTQAISDIQNGLTPNHSDLNLNDGTNPHGTTKTDVGLSNVDNTSDANKPISSATQNALDGKVNNISFETQTADFAPSGQVNNKYIDVDKATDVTITFNTGAFEKDGDVVYFQQVSAGRLLFVNGTASITAAPSLSLVSGGVESIQAVIRKSASVYILTGTTE